MVKNSADRGFETADSTWTATGVYSIVRSTTDKKSGTYSLKVTADSIGNGTTHYIQLPSSSTTTITAGEKYTKEIWARGTGILGANVIPDSASTFSTGGTAYWNTSSVRSSLTRLVDSTALWVATGTNAYLQKTTLTTSGTTYEITARIKGVNRLGTPRVYFGATGFATGSAQLATSWQTITFYGVADGTS